MPGLDHKDNFSPVVSDTTFRYVMVLALMNNYEMELVDIETAFLYGILEEEIFMKIPEGLDVYKGCDFDENRCLVLDKTIYGLVTAARQFHRRITKAMEDDMSFDKCLADECLLRKETKKGNVIVCVYINDTLCVGDKEAINGFKKEISLHFDNLIMFQNDLINKIEKIFGEKVKNM